MNTLSLHNFIRILKFSDNNFEEVMRQTKINNTNSQTDQNDMKTSRHGRSGTH